LTIILFFHRPASTKVYTLSLHDALPISGIWGYEETVIPDLERAILAGHDVNLLGLRGQAKTRLARLMVHLLDEYIPIIEGSELKDRKSTRLNSSHVKISYAVFCLKKKKK